MDAPRSPPGRPQRPNGFLVRLAAVFKPLYEFPSLPTWTLESIRVVFEGTA